MWWILPGLFLLFVVYLIHARVTGKWEYRRFLREMECESIHLVPVKARQETNGYNDKFLRGVVYFKGEERAFHFTNERVFLRVVEEFSLPVEYPKPTAYVT